VAPLVPGGGPMATPGPKGGRAPPLDPGGGFRATPRWI
jgi:hypothetical protein